MGISNGLRIDWSVNSRRCYLHAAPAFASAALADRCAARRAGGRRSPRADGAAARRTPVEALALRRRVLRGAHAVCGHSGGRAGAQLVVGGLGSPARHAARAHAAGRPGARALRPRRSPARARSRRRDRPRRRRGRRGGVGQRARQRLRVDPQAGRATRTRRVVVDGRVLALDGLRSSTTPPATTRARPNGGGRRASATAPTARRWAGTSSPASTTGPRASERSVWVADALARGRTGDVRAGSVRRRFHRG